MASSNQTRPSLDQSDFMRLLMRHEPALRAYSRSILPNWNLVDEVIQEASLTIWEKIAQLQDEDGFLPWAKVIVRFKCLSALGKLRRDQQVFSEGVLELLADEAESFDVEEREQSMQALRSCLNNFSKPHQELLLAPYSGDGQVTKIAGRANKSANSLYKLLGRLREKLATCIESKLQQKPS